MDSGPRGRSAPLLGAMLERRYRVDSLIARGGMSTVYRGLDTRLDRPVAIKVMDSQYSGDRAFTERFEGEARAAAKLHHPNVVAVYDQGVDTAADGEHVFLVMQLVEGATLRDLIHQEGTLPLPMAVTVMESVLAALAAAHQAGMVHRDIKPENVLIGKDGTVRVADFGLVRAAASSNATSGNVILGTVAYLSPEQVTTGAADARSDVYAAGVVFYEMLTGAPPYEGDTALSVAYQHVNNEVPPPSEKVPELAPATDDLVLRATRRDTSARPEGAAAFLEELRRVRGHLGIAPVAVPIPWTEQETSLIATDDPPTDRFAAVGAATAPYSAGGPQGTMALARQEPVPDEPDTPLDAGLRALREPESEQSRRQRSRRTFALWSIVVLGLAVLIGGTAWWLGSGRYVAVPDVTGQTQEVAEQTLAGAELSSTVVREHHDTIPAGVVISSSPQQGSDVAGGSEVELVVSLGKPTVPEITEGTEVGEAERALRDAKLTPQTDGERDQYSTTVPEGRVLLVDPGPGTELPLNAPVTLILSRGPPPVPVPDVSSMSREQAFATLTEAGFAPFEAGQEFSGDVENNHVISTEPAAGTEVLLEGRPRVGVTLSNAVTVPSLMGVPVEEARRQVAELGLNLEVQSFFDRPNSVVLGQFPFSGTKVEPRSTVRVNSF
ncbi:Stk1 family PASTA domain-containing Ser/Thr kinase [Allosaccharopolyspora coralli]|nr:Stk1 family PASTA domain-containing Ser/Thr kinase [Allosaccharopolyspora coralli]